MSEPTVDGADVALHMSNMLRLIRESRERLDELEACVKAIVLETKIVIPHERMGKTPERARVGGAQRGAS